MRFRKRSLERVQRLGPVLDIGGMAKAYPGIYWVLDDGNYLETPESMNSATNAFQDFPGFDHSDGLFSLRSKKAIRVCIRWRCSASPRMPWRWPG